MKAAVLAIAAGVILSGAGKIESAPPDRELWAGHQVVYGKTRVPVLGERETRSESFLLAEVTRRGDTIEIVQQACKVAFKKVAGVSVTISEEALLQLPKARFRFEMSSRGEGRAAPWAVGWRTADIDRDGAPGLSVEVDASICSGTLHVASHTLSKATGRLTEHGMAGEIEVRVKQEILGSDSMCLSMFSKDSEEHQTGGFAYRRVPASATCERLLERPWPITAVVKQ